jgi:AraC family transcriptional regulator, transcriptional activator FtrA
MIHVVRKESANSPAEEGDLRIADCRRPRGRSWSDTVTAIVYDRIGIFELGVAFDTFGNDVVVQPGDPWYRFSVCGPERAQATVLAGVTIQPQYGLERTRDAGTVIVLPTEDLGDVPVGVFDALRKAHKRGARLLSLCTGSFVLAEAGLLHGRRATTHWTRCEELATRYPGVSVDPSVLYVDDGDILTSAGSAASIDLCLHVIRCDYGSEMATRVARDLVMPPQRDGGQAQYIDLPIAPVDESNLFGNTIMWAQEHLDDPLTVNDLATRSAMSPRTFARRFRAAMGTTPYQWLQHQRVQLAQRLLETTDLPIELVAQRSGLGTSANLRDHFSRMVYTNPAAYRRTFKNRTN